MAKFKKGDNRPPGAGRKKGSLNKATLTKKLSEYLIERINARGDVAEMMDALLDKAIKDKDIRAMRLIWNYLEGMPVQKLEHEGSATQIILEMPEGINRGVRPNSKDEAQGTGREAVPADKKPEDPAQ